MMHAASTESLATIRGNLLAGLERIAEHVDAGTFHTVGGKGKAPPAQSGHTTLALLHVVEAELQRREQPMLKLSELLDPDLLAAMVGEGYVRTQVHPELPLTIYNYTEKAAFEGVWNPVTLTCRGLIADSNTGEILARPFRKFFNYGQNGAPGLDLNAAAVVNDKLDGSLGILYPTPGGHAMATRGSFASEQAIHATQVWRDRYAGQYVPPVGFTLLFEIIYPENRIVCDYGGLDDLTLLGAVHIESGHTASVSQRVTFGWPGPIAATFECGSLAEALALPPRPNAEGVVVHIVDTDERIKLKQEDYVALHRIVTGLSARTVWEHLMAGKPLADLIEPLPDEFHSWVDAIATGIELGVTLEMGRLHGAYHEQVAAMPDGWVPADRAGRKDFALKVLDHPDKWAMFALLDGRDIEPELLKRAKPEPYITPSGRIFTEETA